MTTISRVLQMFWLLQTYLRDSSITPQSNTFKKCRRIYNRIQRIVFGATDVARKEKIVKDNAISTFLLSGLILASPAAPLISTHAGALVVSQARKPRVGNELALNSATKISRSRTLPNDQIRTRRGRTPTTPAPPLEKRSISTANLSLNIGHDQSGPPSNLMAQQHLQQRQDSPALATSDGHTSPVSTPNTPLTRTSSIDSMATSPVTRDLIHPMSNRAFTRRHSASNVLVESELPEKTKIGLLRSNYLRLESQFLTALVDISNRLVAVPKPARLSALRAELALIAQDLPAEVDIPLICPATLIINQPGQSRHHRVIRLNPAEATSLNSAERVPYLLMLEVLRDDFDFDPHSAQNNELITNIIADQSKSGRRLFDISDASRVVAVNGENDNEVRSDVGTPSFVIEHAVANDTNDAIQPVHLSKDRSPEPIQTRPSLTPRGSDVKAIRPSGPLIRRTSSKNNQRSRSADGRNYNVLATHMRTAAQMLAQLEERGSKRPKAEVAAIKAKIIASMQSLEEQSFNVDGLVISNDSEDTTDQNGPDTSLPSSATISDETTVRDSLDGADQSMSPSAGAARMENDIKTGGVRTDRDDPSAATFGESWAVKKERIRRSSPYGWMPKWDLISVIVKTGADLRQEAFACQLISVCSSIWQEASIPVWVRNMRILVTGESSGLIETITNGVSLHSLKRSLTLSLNSSPVVISPISGPTSATKPTKRLATLKDHFLKSFGASTSQTYISAAENFASSLAAYSVISYIFQLKDRHNGNILLDDQGHIIHIDFGFMLSNTPGSMGFEAAPFKLTMEYIDVLGGVESATYKLFTTLMKDAFKALRREAERIITLVELMGMSSKMPCYAGGVSNVVSTLRSRFVLEKSERDVDGFVDELIAKSAGSYYTRL